MSVWKNDQDAIIVNTPLDVNLQDQTTEAVGYYLFYSTGTVTLSAPVLLDATIINLVAGHGVTVGMMLQIKELTRSYQGNVIAVNTNAITLNAPLDFPLTIDAVIEKGTENLATLNGTQASPKIAYITPPVNIKWDVTEISLHILDGSAMDDSKFGGLTALTNGCVLRINDGYSKNINIFHDNKDIIVTTDTAFYSSKAAAGEYGFFAKTKFGGQGNFGIVFRINGSTGDRIELIVQDNLTDLTHFCIFIQGHTVQD